MMMVKGVIMKQQTAGEDNMSNLTSASVETSVSSGNRAENGSNYGQQYFAGAPPNQTQPVKKKRNLPGNPDPDAEVIALSPKSLMATNRFLCEVCNKGFQRDQNLQLHRRGHNLPWKLKQRTSKEVRKKVYVCPEPSCVHHDPARALGDLTGIKKHFCRKHGEKKWKCEKCSKKYAVQSDWKAHSKTCGTREYRCDCGTLFSRRDSFITHRAFCDALAEESSRSNTVNPLHSSQAGSSSSHINFNPHLTNTHQNPHAFPMKKEEQNFNPSPNIPPWLIYPPPPNNHHLTSSSILNQDFTHNPSPNPNPNPRMGPTIPLYHPTTVSSHMSATALLQKAAQMGSTMSPPTIVGPHQTHVSANSGNHTTGFGPNLSSREEMFVQANLASYGNKAALLSGLAEHVSSSDAVSHPSFLQEMMNSLSSGNGFAHGSTFDEDTFSGLLDIKKEGEKGNNGNNEGMTRDFLGLRALSHSDILSIAGFDHCMNNSQENSHQTHKTWQG